MTERASEMTPRSKPMNETRGRRKAMGRYRAKLAGALLSACAAMAIVAPAAHSSGYTPIDVVTAIGVGEANNKGEFLARGMAVDPQTHDLFLGGMAFEGRMHKWDGATEVETVFGREEFWGYFGAAVDPNTHEIYALNAENKRLEKYVPSTKKGTPAFFQTEGNGGVALGPEGHFFIPKSPGAFGFPKIPGGEGVILEYSHVGALLNTIECTACPTVASFNGPTTVALDADGNLFVADSENHRVIEMENDEGEFKNPTVFSTGPSTAVAVDQNTGRVFVGGQEDEESPWYVRAYDSEGNQIDEFGEGLLGNDFGIYGGGNQIAVDQGTGNVYVSATQSEGEFGNIRARVFQFAELDPPTVETEAATVEASRHVTLNGTVSPNGNLVLNCHFEYGPTAAYGESIPCTPDPEHGSEPVSVSAEITGLDPNTSYHYRVVATNEGGTTEGVDEEFTTLIDKPVVVTGAPSDVTPFTATVGGTVNPLSNPVTSCQIEYGVTDEYGAQVPCPSNPGSGGSPVAESVSLSGLSASTTYHYRLVAGNAGGVEPGADTTFTTLPRTPITTTGANTNLAPDGAKLLGRLNPEGSVATYRFEYGTSNAYGQSTPPATAVGAEEIAVSAVVGGLVPNTTYHYRLVATNGGGTTHGADQMLTTLVRPVGHVSIPARASVKGGKASVPLTCKGTNLAECKGTLILRARLKKGIRFLLVQIGSASYDFFGQQTKVATVKLNRNGRKVLGQSRGKPVPAVGSAGGANRELLLITANARHKRHGNG
jgi:hypothetical protein